MEKPCRSRGAGLRGKTQGNAEDILAVLTVLAIVVVVAVEVAEVGVGMELAEGAGGGESSKGGKSEGSWLRLLSSASPVSGA